MSEIRTTRILMIVAVFGLLLSLLSRAHGETFDAGVSDGSVIAAEGLEDSVDDSALEPDTADDGAKTDVLDAPQTNPAEVDPAGEGSDLHAALKGGQYLVAFGIVLMFFVWLVRAFLDWRKVGWVKTRIGGFVLSFGTSFALAVGIALESGAGLSVGLFTAAAIVAWGAAGARRHLKGATGKLTPKAES